MAWTKAPEDERRHQVVDAAGRVVARGGLRALTLRAVAAEAGFSHGLVVFHFGGKQGVVDALLEEILAWLATRIVPGGTPRDVWDVVAAETAGIDPAKTSVLLEFWMIAGSDDAVRRRIAEAVERYERGIAEVITAPDDLTRRTLAGLATTLVFGTALRATLNGSAAEPGPGLRIAIVPDAAPDDTPHPPDRPPRATA